MIRHRHSTTRWCLVVVLICTLIPKLARADDDSLETPIRLYANAVFGPIGKVFSLGAVEINGRRAVGEQAIWGGEMLEVSADSSACVMLDSVGQVALRSGVTVRLATTLTTLEETTHRRVLIATLVSGDMIVKLQQEAIAYIEAGESSFTASSGASFRIRVLEGRAIIDNLKGKVDDARQPVVEVNVRTAQRFVRAARRQKKPIKVITTQKGQGGGGTGEVLFIAGFMPIDGELVPTATGQAETPAGNRSVRISVDPLYGSVDKQLVTTNGAGIADVVFTAGNNPGSTVITFDVVRENADEVLHQWQLPVSIVKGGPPTKTIVSTAAIAAAIITLLVTKDGNKKPLMQNPPPQINP